jgi:hypothetical protein
LSVEILHLHTCELTKAKTDAVENNNDADDNLAVRGVGEGTDAVGAAYLMASPQERAARYPNPNRNFRYAHDDIGRFLTRKVPEAPSTNAIGKNWAMGTSTRS